MKLKFVFIAFLERVGTGITCVCFHSPCPCEHNDESWVPGSLDDY